MKTKQIQWVVIILGIGIISLGSPVSAEYRFSQSGFTGGGVVSGTFEGIDTTGPDGVPDGKITYCSGSRTCDQADYDNVSRLKIKFSGNGTFNKLNLYPLSEVAVFEYDIISNYLYIGAATDTTNCGAACLYYDSEGQILLFAGENISEWPINQPLVVIPPNESWVSGTAASMELPTAINFNAVSTGALFTIPSSVGGTGAWVHIPLAVPVILSDKRTALSQVQVKYSGTAMIDQIEVWDGIKKLISKAVFWTGWDGESTMNNGININPKIKIHRGINVSLHIKNDCPLNITCPEQAINIISVGGMF